MPKHTHAVSRKHVECKCANINCGKTFLRVRHRAERYEKHYCNKACQQDSIISGFKFTGRVKVYYGKVLVYSHSFKKKHELKKMLKEIDKDYPGGIATVSFNN